MIESPCYKTNKMTCAFSEHSDQPGYPPSLISLRCPHEETLDPWLLTEHTAKTLIRQADPSHCWGTDHFVGFITRRLIFTCRLVLCLCHHINMSDSCQYYSWVPLGSRHPRNPNHSSHQNMYKHGYCCHSHLTVEKNT